MGETMATTPQTNTTLDELAEIMRANDDFVICGHVGPDGDCLGSQLTLWHALKAMGKNAVCLLVKDEPVPASLSFLPGIDEMVPACAFSGTPRVFVGTDVPLRERMSEDACRVLDSCETSITIDHHASETTMCEHVYVDPDSASASILLWELAKLLVDEPPLESALCAYVGLVTDTGGFRFQNTDADAFKTASELIDYGVQPAYVAAKVFQSRSRASLLLESTTISRMRILCDGAVAISWVTKADMAEFGAEKADAEPLIDTLRSIRGVRVACMLREQDGFIRGSLRAKDETDVSKLARQLNGGGHKAASGISLYTSIDEAVALLEEKLTELVSER